MRSRRIKRTLQKHAKRSIKKTRRNKKKTSQKVKRSIKKSKNRKVRTKNKKNKKSRRRKHKFQKFLTQDYVNKFRSPHQNPTDCAVCSLNFLNVLPKESLQDMIDEVGCMGIDLEEVRQYFIRSYGEQYNFNWLQSEYFITSKGEYRLDYIISVLKEFEQNITPGHASLLGISRDPGRIGHFVVVGRGVDTGIVLFETVYNPNTGNLGIYVGYDKIIEYFMKQDIRYVQLLWSDLVESEEKLNVPIPMETSELTYRCKLIDPNYASIRSSNILTAEQLQQKQLERERLGLL